MIESHSPARTRHRRASNLPLVVGYLATELPVGPRALLLQRRIASDGTTKIGKAAGWGYGDSQQRRHDRP